MTRFSSIGSALLAAAAMASPAWANVSGAIYTSLFDGSEVNFNIYQSKDDVYLNGGPGKGAGTNAAGLSPDGVYVFMVTSPDGKTLLSQDIAACRQVQVTGGIVVGTVIDPTCPVAHLNGLVLPGGTPVQLMPYADTPNPGGEYKAWLTPRDSYQCGLDVLSCDVGKHGFLPSESKTDNFKVNSVADEIDTRFWEDGQILDGRMITWYDTHGASNTKWSYYDPARVIMHEAHVEAPEIGTHTIDIADQAGCQVGDVFVDGVKTRKTGPQKVAVRITKGMKGKSGFTIFIDVMCLNAHP